MPEAEVGSRPLRRALCRRRPRDSLQALAHAL